MPGPGKIPGMTPPANLLKINAYKKVQETYDDAVKILKDKHLVYGEPGVVEFKFKGENELLFGIGTIDGGLYLQSRIIDNGYIRDSSTGEYISINDLVPILKEAVEIIGGLGDRLDAIDSKNEQQDASIAEMGDAIDAFDASIIALDDLVKALDASVAAMDASIKDIAERFEPIDASFAAMVEKLDGLADDVADMKAAVDERLDTVDSSIADIYEKIANIPDSIGEISDASIDSLIIEFCN